jgi:hypothetical protein
MKLLVWIPLAALATSVVLGACSKTTVTTTGGDDDDDDAAAAARETVPADQLGGLCGGGTSIGDTTFFPDDSCPAGVCVADARRPLSTDITYCSARCESANCPAGYFCDAVTVGDGRVCLKDRNAPAVVADAGADDAATEVGSLDRQLPAYAADSTSESTLSLRDLQDDDASDHDLIFVALNAKWSSYDDAFMRYMVAHPHAHVAFVSVLVDGAAPQTDPTAAEFTQWHTDYPSAAIMLDPQLTNFGDVFEPIVGFPTYYLLDARTLDIVKSDMGFIETNIEANITAARAAL